MKSSFSSPDMGEADRRFLLVQCCHLPQFFYLAEMLRRQFPAAVLDALVIRSDDLDFYLSRRNPFSSVLTPSSGSLEEANYSRILFPLLNRGYRSIKRAARRLPGPAFEVDYQGLARSVLYPVHQPDAAFREYLRGFPHRPLGEKVLFVQSCHPSLVNETEPVWRHALPDPCELTRITPQSFVKSMRLLKGRTFDSSIVFFSGEKGYSGLKLLPFALRVPKTLVVNETGDFFYATRAGLLRFLYQRVRFGSSLPRPTRRIVFIETEEFSSCRFALTSLKSAELFPDSEVFVLCRQEYGSRYANEPGVDRVFDLRKGDWLHNWRTFRQLRRANPDIVSAVFSGRPIFRKAKFLFLLLCDRPGLVFNAAVECYFLKPRALSRMLAREPLRFSPSLSSARSAPIVVTQTEHAGMVRESIRRLTSPGLYPRARLTVVCRAANSSDFADLPGVETVLPYPESLAGWLRMGRQLRRQKPVLVSLILSGRPVFSLHKLFVLALFPLRSKLVFNARLDAYWLRLGTIRRIFRREPLLVPSAETRNEILLIQTEATDTTLKVLQTLLAGRAVGRGRVRLLCRHQDRDQFLSGIEEANISTWTPGISLKNLKLMVRLCGIDRDVVTGIFSGRPVFRLQKLAFFLLPARNRLVFNENLDCFYLARRRFSSVLRLPSLPGSVDGFLPTWKPLLRQTTRIVLWPPRFAYLLSWLTVEKLRRAQRLQRASHSSLTRRP